MSRVQLVLLTLCLAIVPMGCSSARDLARILPGSEPFEIDRWEIAIVASRPINTTNLVQLDVAVQEIDGLGRPAGPGVESGRRTIEVGRPFIWDGVAAAGDRTLQIVSPSSRRDGEAIDLTLRIVASADDAVVETRTLDLRVR